MSGVRCPLTFPLNDFFSETTGPGVIWFKFGHKHYWVKGLQIFTSSCIFSCAVASTGRPGLCLFSKPTYPLFKFVSPSVNCSFRKSIFTTNTFQGIQYFNSFSISVVLDFYIRSLFNGSERGHCASNTSARRDVTIDDVIIRTPDVMCEWLTRRTRYIPNFICLACKLIAL